MSWVDVREVYSRPKLMQPTGPSYPASTFILYASSDQNGGEGEVRSIGLLVSLLITSQAFRCGPGQALLGFSLVFSAIQNLGISSFEVGMGSVIRYISSI